MKDRQTCDRCGEALPDGDGDPCRATRYGVSIYPDTPAHDANWTVCTRCNLMVQILLSNPDAFVLVGDMRLVRGG